MTKTDLAKAHNAVDFGNDSVVCPLFISGIRGGRSLNVEGVTDSVLKAGHVIVGKDGDYKPMPVSSGAYGTLPSGYSYVGVLYKTIPTDLAMASIMTNGEVNSTAAPYPMDSILEAFKAAVPNITFVSAEDE